MVKSLFRSQKGQATVELAITLTLLMFFMFAIIDFGRIFHTYLTLEHAGREAARVASVGGTDFDITERAKISAPSLESEKMMILMNPTKESRTRGTYTTIKLSYPISISTPIFQNILPNPYVVNVETVMRVE